MKEFYTDYTKLNLVLKIIKSEDLDVTCSIVTTTLGDDIVLCEGEKEEINCLIEVFDMVNI